MQRAASPMTALSVTSSRSSAAGTPCSASRRSTRSGRPASSRQRVERLTATGTAVPGVQPAPLLGEREVEHPLGQPQDEAGALGDRDEVARRDEPLGRVLPAQQRLDALDPLAVQGDLGLVVQEQLVVAVERAAQVAEHGEPLGAVACSSGWKTTAPALSSFAAYIAMSALRSSSSVSVPCHGDSTMPMLASTSRITPSTSKGWWSAWRRRSATASASATPSTDGSRTANSSPPRRADGVAVAQDRLQPRAHLASSLSP